MGGTREQKPQSLDMVVGWWERKAAKLHPSPCLSWRVCDSPEEMASSEGTAVSISIREWGYSPWSTLLDMPGDNFDEWEWGVATSCTPN